MHEENPTILLATLYQIEIVSSNIRTKIIQGIPRSFLKHLQYQTACSGVGDTHHREK
jgi:hypothetical protein